MSNGLNKQSIRKQQTGAMDRINVLEQQQAQIVFAVNRSVGVLQNQVSHQAEILDAVVALCGEDTVVEMIQKNRIEKAQAQTDARRQQIVAGLEAGKIAEEETIRPIAKNEKDEVTDEGSLVATADYDENGQEVPGTYTVLTMSGIKPEFREMIVGKGVGFEVLVPKTDENGQPVQNEKGEPITGKVIVLGVYRKLPEAPAAKEAETTMPDGSPVVAAPEAVAEEKAAE